MGQDQRLVSSPLVYRLFGVYRSFGGSFVAAGDCSDRIRRHDSIHGRRYSYISVCVRICIDRYLIVRTQSYLLVCIAREIYAHLWICINRVCVSCLVLHILQYNTNDVVAEFLSDSKANSTNILSARRYSLASSILGIRDILYEMSPTIHLLTAGTPNGHKISILLDELKLSYKTTSISFDKKDQKTPEFLKINPNGRIPCIEDLSTSPATPVFESGAIMIYLTEKYDLTKKMSFEHGSPEYWECVQWLFWMNAGLGPMQGQSNHFTRYAPEKIQYAIDRYQNETKRLYGVLDKRLSETGDYLVGHKYSIADLACWCWVSPLLSAPYLPVPSFRANTTIRLMDRHGRSRGCKTDANKWYRYGGPSGQV